MTEMMVVEDGLLANDDKGWLWRWCVGLCSWPKW